MIRIGINPITWSNDDLPALGGETPLEQCLSEARAAGYDGIELGNKFPRQAAVLRPILESHELSLISGWHSARLLERSVAEEIAALADHRRLLREMGCRVVVFAEVSGAVHGVQQTPLSRRPRLTEREWAGFARALGEVAVHLRDHGLHMAYHHHMGTVIESAAEIDRLMAATGPEVGLLLDTGHLTYAGANPAALAQRHDTRIVHVHCKDVRPRILAESRGKDSSFLDAVVAGVFTVPGDGGIDFRAALAPLAPVKYSSWLVVEAEQDPAKAHPPTYARKGHVHLRAVADELGL